MHKRGSLVHTVTEGVGTVYLFDVMVGLTRTNVGTISVHLHNAWEKGCDIASA